MYKQLKITICIYVLLLHLQSIVESYRIYQLNGLPKNDFMPKLKQLLQDQRTEEHLKNNINVRKEQRPVGDSMYVKRIIPHGYRGADYEYDSKLNTVFKPLVRFHVKKPIKQHEKEIINELDANEDTNRKGKTGYNDALIVLVKKDRRNPKDLLRQIKKYINQNAGKRKLKKRFRGLLPRLKVDNQKILRLLEKSGENIDPLAPGKKPAFLEKPTSPGPPQTTKPRFVMPEYPFWNYWTVRIIKKKRLRNLHA